MRKHAPGPWSVGDLGYDSGRQVYVADNTGTTVCDCDWSHTDDECEANARLIAAAPEMYEALCAVMSDTDDLDLDLIADLSPDTVKLINAALLKAEGK